MERNAGAPAHLGDSTNMVSAFMAMTSQMMSDPAKIMQGQMDLWQNQMKLWQQATERLLGNHGAVQIQTDPVEGAGGGKTVEQHGDDPLVGVLGDAAARAGRGPDDGHDLVAPGLQFGDRAGDGDVHAGDGRQDLSPLGQPRPGIGPLEIRKGRRRHRKGVGFVLKTGDGDAGHGAML